MEAELTQMVGANVFQRLLAYLRQRDRLRAQRVALPHPAVRYPKPGTASGFSSVESQFEEGQASEVKSEAGQPAPTRTEGNGNGNDSQPTQTPSPESAILLPE
jgi:hypothetical protein